jgi:hypothetical protein
MEIHLINATVAERRADIRRQVSAHQAVRGARLDRRATEGDASCPTRPGRVWKRICTAFRPMTPIRPAIT